MRAESLRTLTLETNREAKVPWGRWLARRFGSFVLLVGAMLYINRTVAPGVLLVLGDMGCYLAWYLTSFALRSGDGR